MNYDDILALTEVLQLLAELRIEDPKNDRLQDGIEIIGNLLKKEIQNKVDGVDSNE